MKTPFVSLDNDLSSTHPNRPAIPGLLSSTLGTGAATDPKIAEIGRAAWSGFLCIDAAGNPSIPAVYEVQTAFGPRIEHEPRTYAYFDGVDTWSHWAFSVSEALRAKPAPGVTHQWTGEPQDLPSRKKSPRA